MGFIALAGLIAEMGVVRPKMTAVVAIMAGLPGASRMPRDLLFNPLMPSHQPRVDCTRRTTESMTGTSTRTPTTVASAAPDWKPNRTIADRLAR